MISCILKGGLGNQMFQVAAVIASAVENKIPFCFDEDTWPPMGGAGGGIFQASPPSKYRKNVFRKLPFKNIKSKNAFNIYSEPSFHYTNIKVSKNLLLNGYFQSEKYFKNSADIIRKVFKVPQNIEQEFKTKYTENYNDFELVAVHIRRGSHLKNSHYHGSCTKEYFLTAMKEFDQNSKFLIFSDDMEWCKATFDDDRCIFIDQGTDYEDMYYMSLCHHNIICNSTFSWWSAWLNSNPNKKVVSPKKWFGPGYSGHIMDDLVPPEWQIIENDLEGE